MRPAWNPRPRDPRVNPRLSQIEICPGQKFCKGWDRSPIDPLAHKHGYYMLTCYDYSIMLLKSWLLPALLLVIDGYWLLLFLFMVHVANDCQLCRSNLHVLLLLVEVSNPLGLPSSCWCSRRIVRRRLSRKRSSSSLLICQGGKCWENMGEEWLILG